MTNIGGPKDAAIVSGKICDELSPPFFIDRHEVGISCSIGISVYPNDGKDVNMLKANADVAMYHAKRNGRNNYRFVVPEMGTAAAP